jgi:hypothetical protein
VQNFEPFDTSLAQARLKTQVAALREVEGASEYAAVKALRDFPTPCAYVLFAVEAGSGTPRGARVAGASAEFGVVLAVSNYRDRRGEQLQPELVTLLGQVRSALIGWQPPAPGVGPIAWRGGAVMDYDDATLLWVEAYECTHVLQP